MNMYKKFYLEKDETNSLSNMLQLFSNDPDVTVIYSSADRGNTTSWAIGKHMIKKQTINEPKYWKKSNLTKTSLI